MLIRRCLDRKSKYFIFLKKEVTQIIKHDIYDISRNESINIFI
jgi:hypothetical protein